jgi:hypothetical protein
LASIVFYLDFEEFFLAYMLSIYTGLFAWSVFLMVESYFFNKKFLKLKRNLNLLAGVPVFVFIVVSFLFFVYALRG